MIALNHGRPHVRHGGDLDWYPVGRMHRSRIPGDVWPWLTEAASLTRRLQQACPGQFEVEVVSQGWARPIFHEARALGMDCTVHGFIRSVTLNCAGKPWVFARTVIPPRTLRGRLRRLARLGQRPLGAFLFAHKSMRRGELEVAEISTGDPLFCQAVGRSSMVWGRRSVYYLNNRPLLVSEFFLPGMLRRGAGWRNRGR